MKNTPFGAILSALWGNEVLRSQKASFLLKHHAKRLPVLRRSSLTLNTASSRVLVCSLWVTMVI